MLQPIPNPSMKREEPKEMLNFLFLIGLEREYDEKTEEIKKLAYETSTKLKSKRAKKEYFV